MYCFRSLDAGCRSRPGPNSPLLKTGTPQLLQIWRCLEQGQWSFSYLSIVIWKLYCWRSLGPLKCYIIKLHSLYGDICILGRTIFTGTIKQKYFKLNLKIFWYFTKTFLCYGIFFLYFYIGFGILQRFYIETSSAQRENYFMMSSFGNSVISFNVFGTSWKDTSVPEQSYSFNFNILVTGSLRYENVDR